MADTTYISLGTGCAIATELKRRNVREFALPFDWVYLWSMSSINVMLKDKCESLFIIDNWKKAEYQEDMIEKNEVRYINIKYDGFFSVHDFKADIEFKDQFQEYVKIMRRRVKRLLDCFCSSRRIIFVRDEQQYALFAKYGGISSFVNEIKKFKQILVEINPDIKFEIILITEHTNETELLIMKNNEQLKPYYIHSNNEVLDWRRLVIPWDAVFSRIK